MLVRSVSVIVGLKLFWNIII